MIEKLDRELVPFTTIMKKQSDIFWLPIVHVLQYCYEIFYYMTRLFNVEYMSFIYQTLKEPDTVLNVHHCA